MASAEVQLAPVAALPAELEYIRYEHELEAQYLPAIRALISKDLSEPYSIYVYRYFLCQWGHLCFMVGFLYGPSPSSWTLNIAKYLML
jgi:peptide alpha-N-acetyltransferase